MLPLVLARATRSGARRPAQPRVAVLIVALVVVAPWVVRNHVQVGCFAITTDARALWKANNVNTYATLAAGSGSTTSRRSPARRG